MKVDWIKGWGKITSSNTVSATDPNSGKVTNYSTKNIIIATGSVPTAFPGIEVFYCSFYSTHSCAYKTTRLAALLT